MKLRIILLTIAIFGISFLSGTVSAQGIYSKNSDTSTSGSSGSGSTASSPSLRGGPGSGSGWGDPNGNGDQNGSPGDNSPDDVPVGEGLLILSFLAGGYTLLKKRNIKRHEI